MNYWLLVDWAMKVWLYGNILWFAWVTHQRLNGKHRQIMLLYDYLTILEQQIKELQQRKNL